MRITQKRQVAKGCRHRPNVLGFVCYFDDEMAAEIRQRAISQGTSFGEQVRTLVQWGLEDAKEESAGMHVPGSLHTRKIRNAAQ